MSVLAGVDSGCDLVEGGVVVIGTGLKATIDDGLLVGGVVGVDAVVSL